MARRAVQPGRLRRRLTIAFVLVAGASTAALALASYFMVSRARFDDSLARAADDVRYQLVLAPQFLPLDGEHSASLLASFENSGHHVMLVTEAGATPSSPGFDAAPDSAVRALAASGQIVYQRLDHYLVVGGRIPGSSAELYVVHAEDRIYQDLSQLGTTLAAGWALVVLMAALIGRSLARGTLEPVGRASQAARAVAEGLLATRLPVQGRDEFGAWAESFNLMAEALEAKIVALSEAEARERRFTADVAHELRTPVTALVAAASLLREHVDAMPVDARRPAQLLVADVIRLRRLVDELMEISRLDAGQEDLSFQPVDLLAAVTGVIGARGWQETVAVLGDPVIVQTDPRRLERVIANLVANAVEHGKREVSVRVSTNDGSATVAVTDRGPGIAPEHLLRLFERFYKADPARAGTGSGLGLAIARENARLLGGRLGLRSEVGRGTEFRLEMPVTQRLPGGEGTLASAAEGDVA
jgi:signal transduction histidine kinase